MYVLFNGELGNGYCNVVLPVEEKWRLGIFYEFLSLPKIFNLNKSRILSVNQVQLLITNVAAFLELLQLMRIDFLMKFVFYNFLLIFQRAVCS
jgi:hypothetical protein